MRGSILLVDDEKNIVTVLQAILEKNGFQVTGCTEPRVALARFAEQKFDAVITDLNMPEMDGMQLMQAVHDIAAEVPVVMITAYGTVDSAVKAMKEGAFDYVSKPFEQSEIVAVIQKAVNTKRLRQLEVITGGRDFAPLLQGSSDEIQHVQQIISKVAKTNSPVLITGELGTGKEVAVEQIHRLSERDSLIRFNAASVAEENHAEELFGAQKPGRLEMADKGTLFIDEITDLHEQAQQLLLQFLETGEVTFKDKQIRADVRFIVACQQNILDFIENRSFNSALFYKLNVAPIELPSLRKRRDDLPQLTSAIIEKLNRRMNKNIKSASGELLELFSRSSWPGNLRQLENVLERLMYAATGDQLQIDDLSEDVRTELESSATNGSVKLKDVVKEHTRNLERNLIDGALKENEGNITRAAQYLGLSRKGLQLKIKELEINTKNYGK